VLFLSPSLFIVVLALSAPPAGAHSEGEREPEPPEEMSFGVGIDLISLERRAEETRLKVLDLLIVRGLDLETRSPSYSSVRVLRAPLLEIFRRKRDGPDGSLRILDSPLLTLFRRSWRGEEETDAAFLRIPILGSLYRARRDERGKRTDLLFLVHLIESDGDVEPE
jgi:hypothetical protein